MVETPILAAIASNSAMSASDKPGSCWRVSAQNHCANAPRASRAAAASTAPKSKGSASAAPTRPAPKVPKPATSPSPQSASAAATPISPSASAPCQRALRASAIAQARLPPAASSGIVAMRHSAAPAASAVPSTAMPSPDSHQTGRKVSPPATSAP